MSCPARTVVDTPDRDARPCPRDMKQTGGEKSKSLSPKELAKKIVEAAEKPVEKLKEKLGHAKDKTKEVVEEGARKLKEKAGRGEEPQDTADRAQRVATYAQRQDLAPAGGTQPRTAQPAAAQEDADAAADYDAVVAYVIEYYTLVAPPMEDVSGGGTTTGREGAAGATTGASRATAVH